VTAGTSLAAPLAAFGTIGWVDWALLGAALVVLVAFFLLRERRPSLDDTRSGRADEYRIDGFYRRSARQAGFEPGAFLPLFWIAKVILLFLVPLLLIEGGGRWLEQPVPLWGLVLGGVAAFFLPDWWLVATRDARRRKIEWSLPYFLDLIVAFLRSGLGLEESFRRAGREGFHPDHPLAREAALVAREIDLGKDRAAAFRALAARTGVPAMKAVAAALESGLRLGASVEATLRAQADLLRNRRREDTLKRIQLASVKALVPVVLCGLPIFVVIVFFPAFMEILRTFGAIVGGP
jgi:tight adherence protein C